MFRSGTQLERSLRELDNVWDHVREAPRAADANPLRTREIAAMAATARWCYSAAVQRNESRGMHQRSDAPQQNPSFDAHLRVYGVDQVQSRFDPLSLQGQTP